MYARSCSGPALRAMVLVVLSRIATMSAWRIALCRRRSILGVERYDFPPSHDERVYLGERRIVVDLLLVERLQKPTTLPIESPLSESVGELAPL